jgi:hypothetical protein
VPQFVDLIGDKALNLLITALSDGTAAHRIVPANVCLKKAFLERELAMPPQNAPCGCRLSANVAGQPARDSLLAGGLWLLP